MADTLQQLLRERADARRGRASSTATGLDVARTPRRGEPPQAAALIAAADPSRPLHVGVLMGNTPDMLTALAAAGARRLRAVRHQHHPPRRRPGPRHRAGRLPDRAHRRRTPASARRTRPARRHASSTCPPRSGRTARGRAGAGAAPRGRADDTFMMIFTSGTSGEPEGRRGAPRRWCCSPEARWSSGTASTAADVCYLAMPLFHSNAVVRGLERGARRGRGDGARRVLGVAVPARRPALRRDVHELRRQAAGLHPGHPGAARRRRQPAADRVRQRGQRPRHRGVRPPVRLHACGTASGRPRPR